MTDELLNFYRSKKDYEILDISCDSELVAEICLPNSFLSIVFLLGDCVDELRYNMMAIESENHLNRYLKNLIQTFKAIKEGFDYSFKIPESFQVYDTKTIGLLPDRASKVERVLHYTQSYSLGLAKLILTMENILNTVGENGSDPPNIKLNLNNTQVAEIHALCINEGLFKEEYSLIDFLTCFDIQKKINIFPNFKDGSGPKLAYILSKIEGFNSSIALNRLDIRSFDTKKSRVLNDNNLHLSFIKKVDKIFTVKNG